jgi:hypothetical protein
MQTGLLLWFLTITLF